jgi:hypothetical protein
VPLVGTDPGEEAVSNLPVRYWRWTWLGEAIRFASIPVLLALIPVYFGARGLVWVLDQAGGRVYAARMALYRRDKSRSGWEPPPPPRGPAIGLSPEWQERIAEARKRTAT